MQKRVRIGAVVMGIIATFSFIAGATPAFAWSGSYGSYGTSNYYSYGNSGASNYSSYMSPQYSYAPQYMPQYSTYSTYPTYQPSYYANMPYSPYGQYSGGYNPSQYTFESGYYSSCNGQPCGGAFSPNSPYNGGFQF